MWALRSTTTVLLILMVILPSILTHPQISFQEYPEGVVDTPRNTRLMIASTAAPSTTIAEDMALRKSLCPNLDENALKLVRYDKVTKKCYKSGDRGPCGQNMAFLSETESRVYGACDCNYWTHDRPLIYYPETNQCYFVYSKGYCSAKKWLIFNQSDRPVCGFNPCYRVQKEAPAGTEYVPFRGKCVKLGSELEDCGEGKVITFLKDKLLPDCGVKKAGGLGGLSVFVRKLRCSPGSAQSVGGKCRPTIKFNLH